MAKPIQAFQFRDIRLKAGSEIASLEDASKFLGHTDKKTTQKAYPRFGKVVKPTQ